MGLSADKLRETTDILELQNETGFASRLIDGQQERFGPDLARLFNLSNVAPKPLTLSRQHRGQIARAAGARRRSAASMRAAFSVVARSAYTPIN